MNPIIGIVMVIGFCSGILLFSVFMEGSKKSKIRRELKEALDQCWFVSDSDKNKAVELVKSTFPRTKFTFKTDWQQTQREIITYAKVKAIINQ